MAYNKILTTTSFQLLCEEERPREKALNHGMRELTDAELLAILFGTGTQGVSVLELAQQILGDNDGHISRVTELTPKEFSKKYKGIGVAKALLVLAALELGRRSAKDAASMPDKPILSSQMAYDRMVDHFRGLDHEEFWVLLLNNAAIAIGEERIAIGGQTSTIADVRVIMRKALLTHATRIMAFHNHPSGSLKPSIQDDQLTKNIVRACSTLQLRLDDHIIITDRSYYSYHDEGRMPSD